MSHLLNGVGTAAVAARAEGTWWAQTNTGTPGALGTKCSSRPSEVPVGVRWNYFSRSRAALV